MLYVEGSMWEKERERIGMNYMRKYFCIWYKVYCICAVNYRIFKGKLYVKYEGVNLSKGWETATVFYVKTQRKDFFLW